MPKGLNNERILPALRMPFEDAVRAFMGVKPPEKGKKAPAKKKGK